MNDRGLTFIVTLFWLSGCATAIRGTHHEFRVETEPPGAVVSTTLETDRSAKARAANSDAKVEYYGCPSTPCSFEIPRRSKFITRIEKEDYVPVTVIVRSKAGGNRSASSAIGNVGIGTAGYSAAWTSTEWVLASSVGAGLTVSSAALTVGAPMIFIDAASGAMLDTYPNPILLNLMPSSETDLRVIHIDPDKIIEARKAEEKAAKARRKAEKRKASQGAGSN